jgi:uncharacterized protein (TIGR02145 family)
MFFNNFTIIFFLCYNKLIMVKHAKTSSFLPSLTCFLITLTLLSASFLASRSASASDPVIDNVSIEIPALCTLTGEGNTSHSAIVNNGTYVENIGKTTLRVFCNDSSGFSIYAIGFTGDAYSGEDHTKLIGTTTGAKISTGTATGSNSNDPSNWAMKLTKVTDTSSSYQPNNLSILSGYDDYSAVPSTYTKVATYSSSTDRTLGSKLETTYAAFMTSIQSADTYVGKVKYTLVHPANETPLQPQTTEAGKICYYANGSNVLGSMGCQTVSTSATNATLLASNFSREGYGFAGWSTTFDYSDPTGFYGPQEYITFTAGTYTGSNPGLSLYAHWIKSVGSLQDWTGCSSLQAGAVTALTDERDNETYAVAKLADGNCWMIENMRLENTATTGATNIALAQGYETGFTGLADPEAPALFANVTTANSLYSTNGSTINTITGSNPAYRFPRYNNVNTPTALNVADRPTNPTSNNEINSATRAGMYSYGNYYNWAAAAANTTVTSTNDYNTKSICPKGWSLPRGGNKSREATNDSWSLIVTGLNGGNNPANYASSTTPYYTGSAEAGPVANALRAYPNNFVYSGYIYSGSVNNRGSGGYYWSSTANGRDTAYRLYLFSTDVYPGNYNFDKFNGCTIRCIVPSA